MSEKGITMLQQVEARMNLTGDTEDLLAFLDNREPIAETLRGLGLELNEEMNVTANKPDEADCRNEDIYGARERPRIVAGVTDEVMTAGGKLFVTLNTDEDWGLFEVFIRVGKCGEIEYAHLEGLARMVSYCLRTGGRVEGIVDQLSGITSEPVWDRGVLVRSAEDGVAVVLRRFLDGEYDGLLERALGPRPAEGNGSAGVETTVVSEDDQAGCRKVERVNRPAATSSISCVECGGRVVFQEGCMKCLECGYGKCD